jgi:hypothetical protein
VNLQFRMEFYNLFNKTQFRADQVINQLANPGSPVACIAGTETVGNPLFNASCAGHAINTVSYNFAADGIQNFGQATVDRGPREIQYALKINF